MRQVESDQLRVNWADSLRAAYEYGEVLVTTFHDEPAGVLMSREKWAQGVQRLPVEESLQIVLNSREARTKLRAQREGLRRGKHTIVTLWNEERAVLAPYQWAVQAFPDLELPAPAPS
ncbi:hypothetical protein JK358_38230 [Nocardia sp. 2]|uniref:Uncharacterized protein n=1 Tax=Nocardia acididurans TaxID=2802282 RepID=A0ABS1MJM5_9NOCA|nr:hypothetical protein [Nocardia acididurans]MBL1080250.1 hypothetical protein [Nocardia acididurans]